MDHDLIFVPAILFILFVAPLWLVLHYKALARREQAAQPPPTAGSAAGTAQLADAAARMEKRIAALEAMLDAESPGWRQRHSPSE